MNKLIFPYSGYWDYVEKQRHGQEFSETELAKLKADYKRLYNRYVKRRTRHYKKHLTITLDTQAYTQLSKRAEDQQISITEYVKNASLNMNPHVLPNPKLLRIEQHILFLLDSIEELQEDLETTPAIVTTIQNKLHELDSEFQKLNNHDNQE